MFACDIACKIRVEIQVWFECVEMGKEKEECKTCYGMEGIAFRQMLLICSIYVKLWWEIHSVNTYGGCMMWEGKYCLTYRSVRDKVSVLWLSQVGRNTINK